MLRLRLSLCIWTPLVLGACFGRIESDEELISGGMSANTSVGGGAHPFWVDPPGDATGGTFIEGGGVGGRTWLGTGGSAQAGGGPGEVRPDRDLDPLCVEDCCPEQLSQITFSFTAGSLDAGVEKPFMSQNGAWIVFTSAASNLLQGESNGQKEVFSYFLATREVRHLSIPGGGGLGNGSSEANGISSDGRWVLLTSQASNFASNDQNSASDVFLFDQLNGELLLVSAGLSGAPGNGASLGRDLTPDGRFVVFSSSASDLTSDDDAAWDVFVWDRTTGVTERISMGPGDQQTNVQSGSHAHISEDARYVSFHSQSDLLSPGDKNGAFDIFLSDRMTKVTSRVSRSLAGGETDGNVFVLGMSDDARYFSSYAAATDLVEDDTNALSDVFLLDRTLGTTTRVNLGVDGQQANAGSSTASLSSDGRYLTFASRASNLIGNVDGKSQASFLYDLQTTRLLNLSLSRDGAPGNADSQVAQVSRSGRCYVLASAATNLSPESTEDTIVDLFVGRLP